MPYAGEPPGDPSRILSRWKGPLPPVSLSLVGDTSGRQIRTCEDVLKRFRIRSHAEGNIEAVIEVGVSSAGGRENVLRVTSPQRGTVQMYRPGWTVQTLCEDALAQVLRMVRSEAE